VKLGGTGHDPGLAALRKDPFPFFIVTGDGDGVEDVGVVGRAFTKGREVEALGILAEAEGGVFWVIGFWFAVESDLLLVSIVLLVVEKFDDAFGIRILLIILIPLSLYLQWAVDQRHHFIYLRVAVEVALRSEEEVSQ
jgi:hypothetical protein